MSKRKILGVIGALLLAGIGTIALVAYVNDAEERATAGEERVMVFRIDETIPAGTAGEDVESYVSEELVPAKVRPEGSVSSLTNLAGFVAAVDLVEGEQLLATRFIEPQIYERETRRVTDIPAGLQEVTIAMEPQRAGGGQILPGDTVGVFASFEPFDYEGAEPIEVDGFLIAPGGSTPNTTHLILHKVLVTNVQLAELPEVTESEDDEEVTLAPKQNLLVTLAVDTHGAERVVFALEHGTVWLSNEPLDAIEFPSEIQNRATIYLDPTDLRAVAGD